MSLEFFWIDAVGAHAMTLVLYTSNGTTRDA